MKGLRGKTAIITGAAQDIGRAIAAEQLAETAAALGAETMSEVAAFLASDDAAYMTGQAIDVTGGLWLG